MYGYVRPYKPELKVREWDTYKAVYCGLCAQLKRGYGFAARFAVNYDFTFLIMLMAMPDEAPTSERLRCPGTLRKCSHCFAGTATELAADLSVILAYHKLRDGLSDDGFWRNLFVNRPALLLMSRNYKKAAKNHSVFAEFTQKTLDELSEMEHNKEQCADLLADAFGRLLSEAGGYADGDVTQRVMRHLLYCVGKLIYLLDAYDDLDGDRKRGRYNPLLYGYEPTALREELTRLTAEAAADFELLQPNTFHSVLENIFYLGLHRMIEAVLSGNGSPNHRKRTNT